MRGIGFLGLTTVLFWLAVASNVTISVLNRHDRWWEGDGSPYGVEEKTELVRPVVAEPDAFWNQL